MSWYDYLELPEERSALIARESTLEKLGLRCSGARIRAFLIRKAED